MIVKALLLLVTFFCVTQLCYAQAIKTTIDTPTAANTALTNLGSNTDTSVTMAGEYKQPKSVIEQEKPIFWTWSADIGYESKLDSMSLTSTSITIWYSGRST